MRVFDVVHIIEPDAPKISSYSAGRFLVASSDSEDMARDLCDSFNHWDDLDGSRYEVEEHDEESPKRARYAREQKGIELI